MIKRFCIVVIFCIISSVLIPLAVYSFMKIPLTKNKVKEMPSSGEIKVFFHKENEIKAMNVESYLCGVVAAEMPASFDLEALKAQAVAARSYTYYYLNKKKDKHPDASVCTDSTHCKAFKSKSELKTDWKENYKEYFSKIETAVNETKGEVLTYDGEVAMTVFHSQSGGGRTENSSDVWGGEIPYLISVESHGEEDAPNFYSTESLSFDELRNKLSEKYPGLILNSIDEISKPVISDGGSVKSIKIGNIEFKGQEIRQALNLRSSCFEIKYENNNIIFEVSGYGHGVGMSQYGANALAKEGCSYVEILQHYYTGTTLNYV